MKYKIKTFKKDDIKTKEIISSLMVSSLIEEYGSPPDDKSIYDLLEYYYSRPDTVIYYIEDKKQVAGFAWLIESEDVVTSEKFVCFLYLFVHPKFRGNGYSKILMDQIKNYAKTNNINEVRLSVRSDNPLAKGIYDKADFKVYKYEMNFKFN